MRRSAVTAVGFVVAALLGACTGGGDDQPSATTTTTIPVTTTTTTTTEGDRVVLEFDGLGVARFGDDRDAAVAAITNELGPPTRTGGPVEAVSSPHGVCPGDQLWAYHWKRLVVLASDGDASGRTHTRPQVFAYLYGVGGEPPVAEPPLRTAAGITIGSTLGDVKRAYPGEVDVFEDDIAQQPAFTIARDPDTWGGFFGYVTSADDDGIVESIFAGAVCGE